MTGRNVAIGAALLAQLMLVAPPELSAQRPSRKTEVCKSNRWLSPQELHTKDGYSVFMERPAVMSVKGRTFIAGFVRTFDSTGKEFWLLSPRSTPPEKGEEVALGVVADSMGLVELVQAPSGWAVGLFGVEGAVDSRGIAHLIWGTPDSLPATSLFIFRNIWHFQFDGDRWRPIERILTSSGKLMWSTANRSPLFTRGRSLHFALAVQGEGVRYVRFSDGRWTNHHVTLPPPFMGYPQVVQLSTGRLVIAVQGGVHSEVSSSMSALYVTWSDDGGVSWGPYVHVSDSPSEPSYETRLVVDDRDVVSVLWFQQTDEAGRPALKSNLFESAGRIHVAQSHDGGATWRRFPPSILFEKAANLEALRMRDGSVLVALVDKSADQLLTSFWSNDWAPFEAHRASPQPFNPTLGLGAAQRPVLTWGIRKRHGWVGTMMTTLAPCP